MRPARIFLFVQLSNARVFIRIHKGCKYLSSVSGRLLVVFDALEVMCKPCNLQKVFANVFL